MALLMLPRVVLTHLKAGLRAALRPDPVTIGWWTAMRHLNRLRKNAVPAAALGNCYIELTPQLPQTAMQTGFFGAISPVFRRVRADSRHGYTADPASLGSRTRL